MPAAKIIAATVSSMVAGNRTRSSLSTGWALMTLVPEIAVEQVVQVAQVLLPQRIVEAHVLAHRGDPFRRRVLPQDGRRRIARQQVDEAEQDDRQPEQDRDGPQDAGGR